VVAACSGNVGISDLLIRGCFYWVKTGGDLPNYYANRLSLVACMSEGGRRLWFLHQQDLSHRRDSRGEEKAGSLEL